MESYKGTFLDILDCLTCSHCKGIFTVPVTLDCGHSVCLVCAEKIGSENRAGQRCCCCPKCGVESVTEDLWCRVNWALREAAAVVHVVTECLRQESSTPEVSSAGGSESGCSLGTSCSISSMDPPPYMASTRELFIRMFLSRVGLESEDKLSQWSSGFSHCSDRERRSEDEASARRPLSSPGRLCDPVLPQQTRPAFDRDHIMDLLTRIVSDGTEGSRSKTKWELLDILYPFTCPHCKEILCAPVTLDCGHSICWDCADNIGSKNEEGQRCYCCLKCGAESVTDYRWLKDNDTLRELINAVRDHLVCLWIKLRPPEACSAGDSGGGDLMSESSFGSSCSISSMKPPPHMASKGELFNRKSLLTDGRGSEGELSQHCSWSSACRESERWSEDDTLARRALSCYGR